MTRIQESRPVRSQIARLLPSGATTTQWILLTAVVGAGMVPISARNRPAQNPAIEFETPLHFSNHATTVRVATADFNHDGNMDVAATAHEASFVGIFFGDGTGHFGEPTVLPAGSFSVPVATGDFNRDSNQDLAIGSDDGTVWIYLGNGHGGFGAAQSYADGPGEAYQIAVEDFNHDGKLDLAIGHYFGGLAIMQGDGSGAFTYVRDYLTDAGPVLVDKADFNRDGNMDLIVANVQSGNVRILIGDGAFGFSVTDPGLPPTGFCLADFDGDGNVDVVAGGQTADSLRLYRGDGTGGFYAPISILAPSGGLAAADVDGDGKMDLLDVLASPDNSVFVFLGDGAGGFGAPSGAFATGDHPQDLAVADFNNDHKPDLVTPNYFGGDITVLLNATGVPDTQPPTLTANDVTVDAASAAGATVSYSVSVTDNRRTPPTVSCSPASDTTFAIGTSTVSCTATDGAGNTASASFLVSVIDDPPLLSLPTDIHATATLSSGVVVSFTATASDVVSASVPVNCTPPSGSTFPIGNTTVTCSATDGGGNTVTGTFQVTVSGCIGCTAPTFESPRVFSLGASPATRLTTADFNRDGKPDVAVTSHDNSVVAVFLGDGHGNLGTPTIVQAGGYSVPIAAGDFNGDGNPDLAVGSDGGTVWIYSGDGAGGFSGPTLFHDTDNGGWAYDIVARDFDHDGRLDLAVGHYPGTLSILLGDGLGGFSAPSEYFVNGPAEVEAADFNNDGNLDLVTSDPYSGDAALLLGDGTGHFTAQSLAMTPGGTASGDFNGDGNVDLVMGGSVDGYLSVYLGDGHGGFGAPASFWAGGLNRVKVADFNGDGKLDLVMAISFANQVVVLTGDGHGGFGAPFIVDVGDTPGLVAVEDMNQDGRPDICSTLYFSGAVAVFINSTVQTRPGSHSTVSAGNATLTYSNVTSAGVTTVTPIDPAIAGTVPGGYQVLGTNTAYEIQTTAAISGSITIGFSVREVNDPQTFADLRILHGENGVLVDRTVLSPDSPAPDFASRMIFARVSSLSPFVIAVRIPEADHTAPNVVCSPAGSAWYGANVTVACTAFDAGSGLASPADAAFFLTTSVSPGTETTNASTDSRVVCDKAGNCTTAGPVSGVKVDRHAPSIALTAPLGAIYTLNQVVLANYACADGGSGVQSCSGPVANGAAINTSTVGAQSFSVSATDAVGNVSMSTVSYTVSLGGTFTSVTPAALWLGLKNSDDVGTNFDLLAEVLKNGAVVASGQVNSVPGSGSGFNNAALRAISTALAAPINIGPGETLSVRLSVRIAVGVSGHTSGTARLWYGDAAANSRLTAVVNGVTRTFYLTTGSALSTAPGSGAKTTSDVLVNKNVGGNPFKPFGTWTIVF